MNVKGLFLFHACHGSNDPNHCWYSWILLTKAEGKWFDKEVLCKIHCIPMVKVVNRNFSTGISINGEEREIMHLRPCTREASKWPFLINLLATLQHKTFTHKASIPKRIAQAEFISL